MNILNKKIETSRLILLLPKDGDFLTLHKLWSNEKVRKFLGGKIEEEEINAKIIHLQQHWLEKGCGQFVVYEKIIKQPIGLCGFECSDDGIEIVYMFFDCFWGKGYATEAILANLKFGFEKLNFDTIIGITQKENKISCQLLKKVGMKFVENFYRYNAEQSLYKITQSDWFGFN